MSTTTEPQELTFEIVPSELALPPEEKQSLIQSFSPLLAKAKELLEESKGITSAKLARVSRLQFRKLRGDSEALRKSTKEHHLRMGKAIDGAHNILVAAVQTEEKRMEDIEKAEERRVEEENQKRGMARWEQMSPLGVMLYTSAQLAMMTEPEFQVVLSDAKGLHEARLERERKEAEEALAKQVAEAQAREKIRLDNERLLKEAAEREEAARVERERAAAEKAALEEQARVEREKAAAEKKALEDRLAKERADAEAKLAAERAEAEQKALYERQAAQARQDEAEKKAKAEREALEAKHKAEQNRVQQERNAAEAKAKQEREILERDAAIAKAERDAAEAKARHIREEQERQQREAEEAAEAALLAPDKDKLLALAKAIRSVYLPEVQAKKAKTAMNQFATKIANLADWIEERAGEL